LSGEESFKDLLGRSSIGLGLRWQAFGRSVRAARERFQVSENQAAEWAGLPRRRLLEIEAGSSLDEPTEAEVSAIERALSLNPGALWSSRPT
jgi:hypothetical protein